MIKRPQQLAFDEAIKKDLPAAAVDRMSDVAFAQLVGHPLNSIPKIANVRRLVVGRLERKKAEEDAVQLRKDYQAAIRSVAKFKACVVQIDHMGQYVILPAEPPVVVEEL